MLVEGHTGVALFMTLSGYLFAKPVGDHRIDYPSFLWSRAVRDPVAGGRAASGKRYLRRPAVADLAVRHNAHR
jgi:hypothetical protein